MGGKLSPGADGLPGEDAEKAGTVDPANDRDKLKTVLVTTTTSNWMLARTVVDGKSNVLG